jgi:hypothetical protein
MARRPVAGLALRQKGYPRMLQTHTAPAVVSRPTPKAERARYLRIKPDGVVQWVEDPAAATAFASMREAARMAVRLPAGERAFGLPREVEVSGLAA